MIFSLEDHVLLKSVLKTYICYANTRMEITHYQLTAYTYIPVCIYLPRDLNYILLYLKSRTFIRNENERNEKRTTTQTTTSCTN